MLDDTCTLKALDNLSGLSKYHTFQAGQYLWDATTVDRVEILVGEGYEHVTVNWLAVDQLDWQVVEERFFKCAHLIDEGRPEALELFLFDVG